MSQRFLFRRSTLPRTGREASGLVAVVSRGDHELHRSNPREEVEVEVGKERNGHCCFHLVTNPPSVRFKSHKRGLLSDRKLIPLKFSSPQRTAVPARTSLSGKGSKDETFGLMWTSSVWSCLRANFTGGFQKLHRRIETEAAPWILYELRDETTSSLRIFGSLSRDTGTVHSLRSRRAGENLGLFRDIDSKDSKKDSSFLSTRVEWKKKE
ncbi:hypothetical protein F2Q69_00046565 [Brassica cretica]|uniref:Uncharacterized protein n=1 Tax=Brassica cretica TaxID=69181 RepID=A0A8S9PJ79_BRACR|nr:hypothetical protein F2Q69_00046565 [Brassica cretica]